VDIHNYFPVSIRVRNDELYKVRDISCGIVYKLPTGNSDPLSMSFSSGLLEVKGKGRESRD